MAEIDQYLLDEVQSAEELYNCWIELLRTDNVDGANDLGKWDTIPDAYREDFIEAVKNTIVDPLRKYVEDLSWDQKVEQTFQETSQASRAVACYVCGGQTVMKPGAACPDCRYSFLRS